MGQRPLEKCSTAPITGQMPEHPVVVFRSTSRVACEERAFVLTAVQIEYVIEPQDADFVIWVDVRQQAHARHHLFHYERERTRVKPVAPAWPHHPAAWRGSVVYVLVLLLLAGFAARGMSVDVFAVGVMDPVRMRSGEWWRAWTALTLHWDAEHLLGNLCAGALFGYFAAQLFGNGRAWLLIALGAGLANLLEAVISYKDFVSAGASTAVFAALGLVAAYVWRTRRAFVISDLRRAAPLVAGVMLLAFLGTEGEHTDVLSHALGFSMGVLLGAASAAPVMQRALQRLPPWLAASAALTLVAVSWTLAIFA
jgi:rhomboid protease GluP